MNKSLDHLHTHNIQKNNLNSQENVNSQITLETYLQRWTRLHCNYLRAQQLKSFDAKHSER